MKEIGLKTTKKNCILLINVDTTFKQIADKNVPFLYTKI